MGINILRRRMSESGLISEPYRSRGSTSIRFRKRRVIAGGFALEWGANLILTGATKGITLQSVGLAQALREKWRRTDVQLIVVTPRMEAAARDFPIVQMEAREDGFYFENERHAAVGWICRRVRVNASVRSSIVVWIRSNALRWVKAGKVQIL